VVHNEDVVARFEALGVAFVDRPEDAPAGAAVLLSAHGSAPGTAARAVAANIVVDAACPLVTKVHRELRARSNAGDTIIYVGHRGHDETEGAVAQVRSPVHVVETVDDVDGLPIDAKRSVAVLAQTTTAVGDWSAVVDRVRHRFPSSWTPPRDDICFATTNRQAAVRALARECDVIIVVGSASSSNTAALVATARSEGAVAHRVRAPEELPVVPGGRIGITAGASTPAAAIESIVQALAPSAIRTLRSIRESEYFPLAPGVRREIEAAIAAGRVPPILVDAYRNDAHISADALLALVEHAQLPSSPRPALAHSR
jgi:4-hydroxy-3-methylbut-2-enyl diphosphate reductase